MDKNYHSHLHLHGLRRTPQRLAILQALAESNQYLSAQEILEEVRQRTHLTMAVSTAYRTLETLEMVGLLIQLRLEARTHRWALRQRNKVTLLCQRCHQLVALDGHAFQHMAEQVSQGTRIHLDIERMTFSGVCAQCAAEHEGDPMEHTVPGEEADM